MLYQVQYNDSPAKIARKFGVSMAALTGANPAKPTTVVAGVPTWSSITVGETVNVPLGGIVGQPVPAESKIAAIESLMFVGGPCIETNLAVVCGVQTILGVSADGKWGSGTSTAARQFVPNAPPGCSPRPAWWAPRGQSNCTGDMPIPTYAAPTPAPAPVPALPGEVFPDPCLESNVLLVCEAQAELGVTVDGKYGPGTAAAARAKNPNVPPACSPRPAWWAPPGVSNCVAAPPPAAVPAPVPAPVLPAPVVPAPVPAPVPARLPPPTPIAVPAAVQALLTFAPCIEANALAVCAAQKALGVTVDGKYGNNTATAARNLLPNAPAGCSPRPGWWAPPGQSNCVPRAAAPTPAAPAPAAPAPAAPAPAAPAPAAPAPAAPAPGVPAPIEIITPPEKKKGLSTGAIIAGGLGAAALVGITAIAITQKKKPTTKRRRPSKRKKTRKKTRKKKRR